MFGQVERIENKALDTRMKRDCGGGTLKLRIILGPILERFCPIISIK